MPAEIQSVRASVNPGMKQHAIVIGGSMAGLLAARVLTDHFEQITLVERDTNAKRIFQGLQEPMPEPFPAGQLRTLPRRIKPWRTSIARRLVLGGDSAAADCAENKEEVKS